MTKLINKVTKICLFKKYYNYIRQTGLKKKQAKIKSQIILKII